MNRCPPIARVGHRKGCRRHTAPAMKFEVAGEGRNFKDAEIIETRYSRIFQDRAGLFDPALDPKFEIFQMERFWSELQKQIKEYELALSVVNNIRDNPDSDYNDQEREHSLTLVHVLGTKIFKFFTFMRAHLDRNPRDRISFYEVRPSGMEDVYGIFMKILAQQIDFDYCPRCHLRTDGTTTVCGDPSVISHHLYGDNHIFGFESDEHEHSFWTPAWLAEYERRAKDLWYQSLQLPFFRTPEHTSSQCEGLMYVYSRTLNRGEANHFMYQCQVMGLPITEKMVELHQNILNNTNPHSVFFHGDPESVSPRWMRYRSEMEKLDEMNEKEGMVKMPPASYLPHVHAQEMYNNLPEGFNINENGWVSNFQKISLKIQDSVYSWHPGKSQRAQSPEFPDAAYDEQALAEIEYWRSEIKRSTVSAKHDDLIIGKRSGRPQKRLPGTRSRVPGLTKTPESMLLNSEDESSADTLVFPTAYGYETFSTSKEKFKNVHWIDTDSGDSEHWKFGVRPGARIRAKTLSHIHEPHKPHLTHDFPIMTDSNTSPDKLPVVSFSTVPRVMMEILEYGSSAVGGETIEQWRSRRPWCHGLWQEREPRYRNLLRIGAKCHSSERGKDSGSLFIVGAYDGKIWAAKSGQRYASVVIGKTYEDLKKYKAVQGSDMWGVQNHVEVEGAIVGMKDEQIWVQWGTDAVATPMGSDMEVINKNFKNVEILPGNLSPVEPPSWYIPFRNNWREETLQNLLRKPWTDQPLTAHGQHTLPTIASPTGDLKSYKLDDYHTKEYDNRINTRAVLAGGKHPGSRRWSDDSIHSVNIQGNNRMHTGYDQPSVDRDEVIMPIGIDDKSNENVPKWEVDEMEQCLRDIGGRAPGAARPTVSNLSPEYAINDPIEVRKRSRLQIANRTNLITHHTHPTQLELKHLATSTMMNDPAVKTEAWEYGGMANYHKFSVAPHQNKTILGRDVTQPDYTRKQETGKENEYQDLRGAGMDTHTAFVGMHEYFSDLNRPFDVGHTSQFTSHNHDILLPKKPSKTMSVGKKRRMASLLLRLWMKKAEEKEKTLDMFAADYKLNRLSVMAWFGGDSPASPSLLSALKDFLRTELQDLELIDEFKIEDIDTYSPVNEPGFYKYLDKSRFEHQYELLLAAKLRRFDNLKNLRVVDFLSRDSVNIDESIRQELEVYEDTLRGGNVDIMDKGQLDEYDKRTKKYIPRVTINQVTGKPSAFVQEHSQNIGFPKDSMVGIKPMGSISFADIKKTILETNIQSQSNKLKDSVKHDKTLQNQLKELDTMNANTCIDFAKDWNEGLSMDILYAIRRNRNNSTLRERFANFVRLTEDSNAIQTSLDGLYEHEGGSFRISSLKVENATFNGEEWMGDLKPKFEEANNNTWVSELSNGGYIEVTRLSSSEVRSVYSSDINNKSSTAIIAKAKRADLDLEGTLWRLYVEGNWAPGKDEAKDLVLKWTIENAPEVTWKLENESKLTLVDKSLINSALESSSPEIKVEYSTPYRHQDGTIRRALKASGEVVKLDTWVTKVDEIGLILNQRVTKVKVTNESKDFNFDVVQIASDVNDLQTADNVPFLFECSRLETISTQNKWKRLGMNPSRSNSFVVDRQGTPQYGDLLEMLHWLDVLVQRIDAERLAYESSVDENTKETTQYQDYLQNFTRIEEQCTNEVIEYQKSSADPILLGESGFESRYPTQPVSGYDAVVLNQQLPLLSWWYQIITNIKAEKDNQIQQLDKYIVKGEVLHGKTEAHPQSSYRQPGSRAPHQSGSVARRSPQGMEGQSSQTRRTQRPQPPQSPRPPRRVGSPPPSNPPPSS